MRFRLPAFLLALAIAGALSLAGCGDDSPSAADAKLPDDPGALAVGLSAADGEWRQALDDWRADGRPEPLPEELTTPALFIQRTADRLSGDPRLAAETMRRLRPRLRLQIRDLTRAIGDIHRLSAGFGKQKLNVGEPTPLEELQSAYREAKRRFGVGVHVLAAVNLVESMFGRLRNDSVAGARGPMQFIPSTWKIYGLGGDIHDPHDAILGAANYLNQSGAPGSYAIALHHYNPSPLYVDAVLRYAHQIASDPDNLYLLYSFEP
jgi:membrane-bound lytic murein transglycosylase B